MSIYKHEEIYRGKEQIKSLSGKKVVVCGVGAIGSNLIENLCRQGFDDFRAIDFDRVEEHNLNNQAFTEDNIGSYKSQAIEDRVLDINRGDVDAVWKKLDKDNIKKYFTGATLVVDCFDNVPSRKLVSDYCKKNKIPCLHLGVLTDFGEAVWEEQYSIEEPKEKPVDACDYPLARNIVMMVVILGSEIILDYFLNNKKRSAIVTLKNLSVRYI
jgi:molybdopterin/thiamine biosynthesis adenylyltransferase